jgi:predicted nucleic-acid-binding Zn-ribbon protein
MRTSQQCPKCQSRKLWIIDPVRLPNHEGNVVTVPFTAGWIAHNKIEAGRLEAWLCAQCGFVEYYAKDVTTSLEALAKRSTSGVRYLDGSPDAGTPFR